MFELQETKLASGRTSRFKIECDDLTDDDIECFAALGSHIVGRFSAVFGVPTGGERLAKAMEKYTDEFSPHILVVDDVTSTGGSMERFIDKDLPFKNFSRGNLKCLTIFNRGNVEYIHQSAHSLFSIFNIDQQLYYI